MTWLLKLLGPLALELLPGRGTVYLLLGALVGGFGGGVYVTKKFWDASEVTAVNEARAAEQDAVRMGDEHSKGVLDRARQRKETNDAKLDDLRRRLARAPRCNVPVPADWLRNDRLPATPPDPRRARSADAPVDPAADPDPVAPAADVVLTCERNRTDVYQPEADERAAIRAWYEDLRRRYNR